ncbi:MAG: hypothetical protein ACHQII_02960 [Bacteroidia bacterium]
MRKLLLNTLIAFSISSLAQTTPDYKKFTILVSAGASVPIQDFGKKTFNRPNTAADTININGFASTGVNFNLSVSYKFVKKLGVMLQASQTINRLDNTDYANAINTAAAGAVTNNTNIQTSGPYHIGQYLIGLCLSLPLEEKVSFEAHALIGETTAANPKITETQITPQDDVVATTKYNNGTGFGYNLGMGVKCMFNKTIGLQIMGSYAGSKISCPGYNYTYTDIQTRRGFVYNYAVTNNYSTSSTRYMSVGMLNITLGLAFSF